MTYSVLAIDQSPTSSGWAHIAQGDKAPTWGVIELPSWADREGEMMWQWFTAVGNLLVEKQANYLFLEDTFTPSHHETLTQRIGQYGTIGLADMACHRILEVRGQKIDYAIVKPQLWRPPFIGSENPPMGLAKHQRRKWLKDKSVAACHVRGWMVDGNDAADALGILTFGVTTIDPRFAVQQGPLFRRSQTDVFNEARAMR